MSNSSRIALEAATKRFLDTAKPCPFCGGGNLSTTDWWDDDGEILAVACLDCKAEAPVTVWNRREGAQ